MSESEIQEKRKEFSDARTKLEQLKEEITTELQRVLPSYLERKVNDLIRDNHDLISNMPKDRLRRLKESIDAAIPNDVKGVIEALKASDDWVKCRRGRSHFNEILSSPLWKIIESIDRPLLPLLEAENLKIGKASGGFQRSSSIMPVHWNWLYVPEYGPVGETKLNNLDKEYSETLNDYCGYQESIAQLEEEKRKRAASERWKTI